MRQVQALLEGQRFESADELNAKLAELTRDGRLAGLADAWKQDDPRWRAQELAYDALETDDFMEALKLVHDALELDPDCTDAQRLMVALLPSPLETKLRLMREVVETAERNFGEDFIRESKGHFWGITSTRPYMRAMQHLAELLAQTGNLDEAETIYERMIELNPNDNQGMRYPLLGLYLAAHRPEDADRLMSNYGEDESACFAWGRVLERWVSGHLDEAETALTCARAVNPFAGRYLSGRRQLTDTEPDYYSPGDEAEARICARELAPACRENPGFRQWLRERSAADR